MPSSVESIRTPRHDRETHIVMDAETSEVFYRVFDRMSRRYLTEPLSRSAFDAWRRTTGIDLTFEHSAPTHTVIMRCEIQTVSGKLIHGRHLAMSAWEGTGEPTNFHSPISGILQNTPGTAFASDPLVRQGLQTMITHAVAAYAAHLRAGGSPLNVPCLHFDNETNTFRVEMSESIDRQGRTTPQSVGPN